MTKKTKNLGNPIVAASAMQLAQNKGVQRGVKIAGLVVLTGGLSILAYRLMMKARERNFMRQNADNINVQTAMLIYAEIPEKLKQSGTLINPINLVNYLWSNVKFWEYSSDNKLLELSKQITDIKMVRKTFSIVYNEDFNSIMEVAMKAENYVQFMQNAGADKNPLTTTESNLVAMHATPKKNSTVVWVVSMKAGTSTSVSSLQYVKKFYDKDIYLGVATGKKQYFQGIYYVEILNSTKTKIHFIEEKDLRLLTPNDYNKIKSTLTAV